MPDSVVQTKLQECFPVRDTLRILEAGGGSRTYLEYPRGCKVTVIDISPEQLERNEYADEKILGDIQTYDFSEESYDVVVCWDVLEHLKNPNSALDNLFTAVAPRGLVVISGPIVNSPKGLLTKYTPHTFHISVYRHVLGSKNAGRPGYAPFPTHLRAETAPNRVIEKAKKHSMSVAYLHKFESAHVRKLREKYFALWLIYKFASLVLSLASFNKIERTYTDFILALRKHERER